MLRSVLFLFPTELLVTEMTCLKVLVPQSKDSSGLMMSRVMKVLTDIFGFESDFEFEFHREWEESLTV